MTKKAQGLVNPDVGAELHTATDVGGGISLEKLTKILADNEGVVSTNRNIESLRHPGLFYQVISVVRYNTEIDAIQDAELRETTLRNIWGAAMETFILWTQIADTCYDSDGLVDNPLLERQYRVDVDFPRRINASNVTVYGTVFTKTGENISVTLTEMSDPRKSLDNAMFGLWFYKSQTDFGAKEDLNKFGAMPFRVTTLKQGQRTTVLNDKSAALVGSDNAPRVVNDMKQLVDVRADETFMFKVSRIEMVKTATGEDAYKIYGFTTNSRNQVVPLLSGRENVYIFASNDANKGFVNKLSTFGIKVNVDTYADFDAKSTYYFIGEVRKKKNSDGVWYVAKDIVKEE